MKRKSLTVIGSGEYFKKIFSGLNSNFDIIGVVDSKEFNMLDISPVMEKVYYKSLNKYLIENSDCFMILTPPSFHYDYFEELKDSDKILFIEKPLVSTIEQLNKIIKETANYSFRLYCSDHFSDIRALPLLMWMKRANVFFEANKLLSNNNKFNIQPGELGGIKKIEGKLLECENITGIPSDRISWLLNAEGGGVLLDLMYHYFMISFQIFEDVTDISEVSLSTIPQYSKNKIKEAEIYAFVEGVFDYHIPFVFEVGKYCKSDDRMFKITFEKGSVTMFFDKKNRLLIEKEDGAKETCFLNVEHFKAVGRLFKEFSLSNIINHNLNNSKKTLLIIDKIKKRHSDNASGREYYTKNF